jgi:hypothetical protein
MSRWRSMVVGRSRLDSLVPLLAEEAQHEVVFILPLMVIRDAEAVNVWQRNALAHRRRAEAARVVTRAARYCIVARLPIATPFTGAGWMVPQDNGKKPPQDAGHE